MFGFLCPPPPFQIIVPCCLALFVALVTCEGTAAEDKKAEETEIEPKESQNVEKRGIYGSIGDYGHDFGHQIGRAHV